jgi:hypothetical protein
MIQNASNRKTRDLASGLPDVGASIQILLQPVVATYIQKQQISGYTQEVSCSMDTKASIQPWSAEQLKMLPEGQRSWKYFTIYALANLNLATDEVFTIYEKSYRILDRTDWSDYGFIEYNTIEDYDSDSPEEIKEE